MITRIELTNFMSHKRTVIEPAPGLTVLIGPNNIGKSAIVAALQILCHNENSTHVMRHGERECQVVVETDDGHTIEWRRKTSPSYKIDGQSFDRLRSGGLPDELHKALKLPKVDAGNEADFDVHFGMQKTPIFLLGSSASNAARFFASSSDAIRLVAIQKRHKEKHNESQREKTRLEAESRQLNTELEQLEPIVDVDHRLTTLEATFDELSQATAWLQNAETKLAALRDQTDAVACQTELAGSFDTLTAPPQLTPAEPLAALLAALEVAEQKQAAAELRAAGLSALTAPPTLADSARLTAILDAIAPLEFAAERSAAEQAALAALSPAPQLEDADSLGRLIDRIAAASAAVEDARQTSAAMHSLAAPPELAAEAHLADLLASHEQLSKQVARWQETYALLEHCEAPTAAASTAECETLLDQLTRGEAQAATHAAALAATNAELAAAAEQLRAEAAYGVCAACGGALDPDRVLARAAAGLGVHDHG